MSTPSSSLPIVPHHSPVTPHRLHTPKQIVPKAFPNRMLKVVKLKEEVLNENMTIEPNTPTVVKSITFNLPMKKELHFISVSYSMFYNYENVDGNAIVKAWATDGAKVFTQNQVSVNFDEGEVINHIKHKDITTKYGSGTTYTFSLVIQSTIKLTLTPRNSDGDKESSFCIETVGYNK